MSLDETATSRMSIPRSTDVWRLLCVFAPPGARRMAHTLTGGAVTVGRDPGDEVLAVALEDREASRKHARFEPDDTGWAVTDLRSHNGTFVNGRRVDSASLRHGDVVRLGSHLMVVQRIRLDGDLAVQVVPEAASELPGQSFALAALRAEIARVAPTGAPLLVMGESGVGKELVAREIHRLSGRAGPLVPVNSAALPSQLAESELFGHAAGAFTGATGRSEGLFDRTEGGTLFLDEIGEMPVGLQAKLLRAVATSEVRAVGDTEARRVDVRVIAATNVDLDEAVERGSFRGDLYARLAGERLIVPPLRDRREEIVELSRRFLEATGGPSQMDVNAVEALLVHRWPYNVRELEQAMGSIASRARGAGRVELEHLPPALREPLLARAEREPPETGEAALPLALRVRPDVEPTAAELELVARELDGNVKRVAEFFGRYRAQIYRWADRLGVDFDSLRD